MISIDATKDFIGMNTVVTQVFLKILPSELEIKGKIDSDLALKIY